jgi:hypothetical protein
MNLEGVSHCRQTHFPIQEIRTRHRFSNWLKFQNEQSIQQDVKCVVLQHLNFAFCDPHRLVGLMLGVCWAHLGSMLGRVGPMLGHPGPMLYPHWWKSNQQIVNPHVFFFEGCGLPFSVRHFCHVSKWRGPDIGEQRCGLVSVMKCTI